MRLKKFSPILFHTRGHTSLNILSGPRDIPPLISLELTLHTTLPSFHSSRDLKVITIKLTDISEKSNAIGIFNTLINPCLQYSSLASRSYPLFHKELPSVLLNSPPCVIKIKLSCSFSNRQRLASKRACSKSTFVVAADIALAFTHFTKPLPLPPLSEATRLTTESPLALLASAAVAASSPHPAAELPSDPASYSLRPVNSKSIERPCHTCPPEILNEDLMGIKSLDSDADKLVLFGHITQPPHPPRWGVVQ